MQSDTETSTTNNNKKGRGWREWQKRTKKRKRKKKEEQGFNLRRAKTVTGMERFTFFWVFIIILGVQ